MAPKYDNKLDTSGYPKVIAELLIKDSNGDDMEKTVANNDMLNSDEESSDRDSYGNDH